MKSNTCCFTGHRVLPIKNIGPIVKRLEYEIMVLIKKGVTNFISGGALGFDQLAASIIVSKKEQGYPIRLLFALPCHNQEKYWNQQQKNLYQGLLAQADEIRYISEKYDGECMKRRNAYMVEKASVCVCALNKPFGGTYQTAQMARKQGVAVINVLK